MRSFLLALALALALAAPAMAQDATQEGYSAGGPAVLDQTDNRGDPAGPSGESPGGPSSGPSSDGASTLPFTGMDLVLVAGFGLGLLGLGAGMRRLTRPAGPVSS